MDFESLMYGYRLGNQAVFVEPKQTPLGMTGNLLSRSVGSSLEFMEHREYLPGDDLRRINWNAYARSDRLAVKLFREEVNPHIDLLLDVSRSMNLVGTKKGKATYALTGFFASAAAESRFSFRVFVTDNGCRILDRSHLTPLDWEPFDLVATSSPNDALFQMPPDWRPRGIRIFVSDFLFMADPNLIVSQIAEDAAVTILVQLLAESDAEPPEQGNLRLTDCENGERLELYLDLLAREQYKQNLARHQENYHLAARRHGAFLTTVIAELFLETGRLDELFHLELLKYS
ncbi:MAG: DUF58 domain-containing protein [Planctomycetaceae bacterium]|jgi:uncharacterized protein (DUF58 family)|nr:DUF58 domain-containing protein [Planctomycetaceae bacterium]